MRLALLGWLADLAIVAIEFLSSLQRDTELRPEEFDYEFRFFWPEDEVVGRAVLDLIRTGDLTIFGRPQYLIELSITEDVLTIKTAEIA